MQRQLTLRRLVRDKLDDRRLLLNGCDLLFGQPCQCLTHEAWALREIATRNKLSLRMVRQP